jgi:hypothetical protein
MKKKKRILLHSQSIYTGTHSLDIPLYHKHLKALDFYFYWTGGT